MYIGFRKVITTRQNASFRIIIIIFVMLWRVYNIKKSDDHESYQLEFIEPVLAIKKNRNVTACPSQMMLEREVRVLERLISEGLIK